MKNIFKLVSFTLFCVMLLSLAMPVSADVIIEPEDDFYEEHRDECVYNNYRQYVVNTDKGYAYLYVNPESSSTIKGYSNGDIVYISWLYTDKTGEVWGVLSYETGWFRMSDLTVVYDGYSFIEDHGHEFKAYTDGSYSVVASENSPVVIWTYPGKSSGDYFSEGDIAEYVRQTYTDENGVVWGCISYYMGRRNVWVCLNESNSEITTDDNETETATEEEQTETVTESEKSENTTDGSDTSISDADTEKEDEKPTVSVNGEIIELKKEPTPKDQIPMSDGNLKTVIIVGSLVAGVVIITAIVLVLYGKKRSKKNL